MGFWKTEQAEQSWTGGQLSRVSGWLSKTLHCSYCAGHLCLHWTFAIAIPKQILVRVPAGYVGPVQ